MRFEKAEDLLNLAFAMQSTADGVSLAEIEEMYEVSRRTAMRMRMPWCEFILKQKRASMKGASSAGGFLLQQMVDTLA
jgi:predicted DNA-binding transcriptional regulator YafY